MHHISSTVIDISAIHESDTFDVIQFANRERTEFDKSLPRSRLFEFIDDGVVVGVYKEVIAAYPTQAKFRVGYVFFVGTYATE